MLAELEALDAEILRQEQAIQHQTYLMDLAVRSTEEVKEQCKAEKEAYGN